MINIAYFQFVIILYCQVLIFYNLYRYQTWTNNNYYVSYINNSVKCTWIHLFYETRANFIFEKWWPNINTCFFNRQIFININFHIERLLNLPSAFLPYYYFDIFSGKFYDNENRYHHNQTFEVQLANIERLCSYSGL